MSRVGWVRQSSLDNGTNEYRQHLQEVTLWGRTEKCSGARY